MKKVFAFRPTIFYSRPLLSSSSRLFHFNRFAQQQTVQDVEVTEKAAPTASMKELSIQERIISIICREKQFQITTSTSFPKNKPVGANGRPEPTVSTSIVPYRIVPKDKTEKYLKSIYSVANHPVFQHFDIVFLLKKDSPHNDSLQPQLQFKDSKTKTLIETKEEKILPVLDEKIRDMLTEEKRISITVGAEPSSDLTQILQSTLETLPHRVVLLARAHSIPNFSPAFRDLWSEFFKDHPNVKVPSNDVNMFRITHIESCTEVQYTGNVNVLSAKEEMDKLFKDTKPDPLATQMYTLMKRLNGDSKFLVKMAKEGYDLKHLKDAIAIHIDRYGIRILGTDEHARLKRDLSEATWQEYFLEFGKEIHTKDDFISYLLEFA